MTARRAGVYVHLPFCVSRCAYCTFVTSTRRELLGRVLAATCAEIAAGTRGDPVPAATLYLGGGTPSLVPEGELEELFGVLRHRFAFADGAEITLEANPDDVSEALLSAWRRLGVTRVSLGVQSFRDEVLAALDRRHTADQARAAAGAVLAAGFHLSVDLILALPGVDAPSLRETLAMTVALRPHHVSVYLLETDKPCPLLARQAAELPDADRAADEYLEAGRSLVAAGFRHYEISNFARSGFVARHNVRYWTGRPVLAFGVAAHSQAGRRRWANVDDIEEYCRRIERGEAPRAWSRSLADDELEKESLMLALRLDRGADADAVERRRHASPDFSRRLDDFITLGLARVVRGRVRLSPRGWLVSSELLAALW